MDMTRPSSRLGLPDPEYHSEFYRDVPAKRLMAWVVDVVLISVIVAFLTVISIFTALFFLPFLYFCISFLYRWATLAAGSATPGMRFMAIELRTRDGDRFDATTAFLHTVGYAVSVITAPLQLISVVMMLVTARGQGLTDMVLGTAAVNRRTR